jgi:hypothetical protein
MSGKHHGNERARPKVYSGLIMANPRASLLVCPHCWNVNLYALRLCGRCGADMNTALQESGGLRWAAAVQSPVPQPNARPLSLWLRAVLLVLVALLALARLVAPVMHAGVPREAARIPVEAGAQTP